MRKKNYLKIPPHIRQKITSIHSDTIAVGCAKRFNASDLQAGCLNHLDIHIVDGKLNVPSSALPPAQSGKYSEWNVEGRTIKFMDLPKEPFYIEFESPNFGDWSKGSHTITWTRWRYPTEYIAPSYTTICIEPVAARDHQDAYIIKFELDEVLDKNQIDFEERLLRCINLLQENIGCCDVQPAGATLLDYLKKLHVEWEILPPGSREEFIKRTAGIRHDHATEQKAEDRYNFLMSLDPKELIVGSSGFARYAGAKFNSDLVVFENMCYGNAVYIMFQDWEELSRRSRTELLSGRFGKNFERIPHTGNWKSRTIVAVRKHLSEPLL